MRLITTLLVIWIGLQGVWSQPLCTVVKYDETDGVSSSHITQLLQDERGFMWFATWNGLCRYDGYEFQTFKPTVGDGCHMTTDRIRNIDLLPDERILCRVEDDYYMFSLRDYRFRNLTSDEQQKVTERTKKYRQSQLLLNDRSLSWTDDHQTQWTLHGNSQLTYRLQDSNTDVAYPLPISFGTLGFAMTDRQGNLWVLDDGSIYKFRTDYQHTHRLAIEPQEEVKCLFTDQQGRYWVATKGDQAIRIYDSSNDRLLGYLGSDGHIHQGYTRFGASVYCMYQAKDGTLWLGTKPDGIFRLQPATAGTYKIDHLTNLPMTDVYHIVEDRYGRLWVATLGGGLCYTSNPKAEKPLFTVPKQYLKEHGQRVRYLHITHDDIMLAATGNGLCVTRLEKDADKMLFRLHQRESERANSLSCSATMDVTEDSHGHLFVSTETGGINQILSTNLLADTLSFRHLNETIHTQGNDIVQALTILKDNRLMAVGSHLVTLIDSAFHGRILDERYFQGDYRFSESHPLALSNNRWLFGLRDGAIITTLKQTRSSKTRPQLVLTSVSIQGENSNYAIEIADSIVLRSDERSLTVRFAALDYSASEHISYAFRLSTDEHWHYIGHDRSATLLDLKPGTYLLEIRSTNADGEWQDNIRRLTIIVTPTFWEAWYGQLLITLLCMTLLAAVLYTYYYIKRIKRQHQQTLEAYLALLNKPEEMPSSDETAPVVAPTIKAEDDALLKRIMKFIEENISDANIGVGDLAAAVAVSRSGLQRKLKQTMGVTPQELLSEARIKHACKLLRTSEKTVAEVAYACGFSDPKYFSKCFKQSTGKTPSEYKNAS